MSNNTYGSTSNTPAVNDKPTIGDKIQSAFSSKTAEEIRAEKNANKLDTINATSNDYDSNNRLNLDYARANNHASSGGISGHSGSTVMTSNVGSMNSTYTNVDTRAGVAGAMHSVDVQAAEASRKSNELAKADEERLLQSATGAYSDLNKQAEHLKNQVDKEKVKAELDIADQQSHKIERTHQRNQQEQHSIQLAAEMRKAELEAKANKVQSELDELARLKVEEMKNIQAGDLHFKHVAEDSGILARLTGAVAHQLGIQKDNTTTVHGVSEHDASQVDPNYPSNISTTQTQVNETSSESHQLPSKAQTMDHNYDNSNLTNEQRLLAESKRNQE